MHTKNAISRCNENKLDYNSQQLLSDKAVYRPKAKYTDF